MTDHPVTPDEALAQRFHETYERLAPSFGYETREASAKPWAEVPERNRALMIAVCSEIRDNALAEVARLREELAMARASERAALAAEAGRQTPIIAGWDQLQRELVGLRAHRDALVTQLAQAEVTITNLQWGAIYRPGLDGGICRACGGKEHAHRMHCRHYVGALEHRMIFRGINGTFGGSDYDCTCGEWFRQGGLAGHGDGSATAEVICPHIDQAWRGPQPDA